MRYCNKCGNQLTDEMVFCQKCGTKFEAEPKAESQTPTYEVLENIKPEPPKKKPNNKQGARAAGVVLLVFFLLIMLIVIISNGGNSNQGQSGNVEVVCDVSKFANISSAELVELIGKPNSIDKTTTNGFAEFPCVYYEYNNAAELGEVSFILINDSVVKLVSYNTYPYNNGKNLLGSFNLTMGENGAKDETETYARYRCVTDSIDDLWITNIDTTADTFGSLQVTYDMFYFEEWYLPMSTSEESNYQWWTQETVKTLLKSPNTADFPNILKWSISKNKFYAIAQSYVDAQNSFGATIRSEFTFIYAVDTSNIVYAVFDGEVIANNGFVKTEELVSQLIDQTKTDAALSVETASDTSTETEKDSGTDDKQTTTEKPKDTSKENPTTQKPTTQNPVDNPTFTGSLCLDINTNTGMPASNVTSFKYTESVCVAGKLSGVSGENNLIVRFTCPDGTTEDTMQYCITNNETINTGLNADWIGAGSGKVQVIFEKTGKVLATYNFTISEPENQVQQRPAVEENFEQLWQQQTLNADWIGEYELQQLSGESDLCFGDMVSSYSGWSNGDGRLIPGFYLQGFAVKELIFVYDMPESFSGTGKYSGINFKYENGEWFFRPKDLVSVGLLNADGSFNTSFPEQTFDPEKAKK